MVTQAGELSEGERVDAPVDDHPVVDVDPNHLADDQVAAASVRAARQLDDVEHAAFQRGERFAHVRRGHQARRRRGQSGFDELADAVGQHAGRFVHPPGQRFGDEARGELGHAPDVGQRILGTPRAGLLVGGEGHDGRVCRERVEVGERCQIRRAVGGEGGDPPDGPWRDEGVDRIVAQRLGLGIFSRIVKHVSGVSSDQSVERLVENPS